MQRAERAAHPDVWMCSESAASPSRLMLPEENGAHTVKSDAEKPASTVVSARVEGFATASSASAGSVTCNLKNC